MRPFLLFLILPVFLIALPLASLHAAASIEAVNLQPATDNGPYLGVDGSRTLGRRRWTMGLSFDYAHEPVIRVNAANQKLQDVIGRQAVAHLTTAYGITPWLQAGLLANAVPYMTFQAIGSATSSTEARMGDLMVNGKIRLLDNQRLPVGFAVVPFVTIPSGSDSRFVGNGVVTGGGLVVIESRRLEDRFSVALNVGARFREGVQLTAGTRADDQLLYGAGMNVALHPKADLVLEARGFTLLSDFFGAQQRPIEFDAGARVYRGGHWAITAGGGVGLLKGIGNPTYRLLAGISWIPEHKGFERKVKVEKKKESIADADQDGIPDPEDRCPAETGTKENLGCPTYMKAVISPEDQRILTQMIHFDYGRSTLKRDALPILDAVAGLLKTKPVISRLSIEGHCDYVGSDALNNRLSRARAEMVKAYLVEKGIERERLITRGWGKTKPLNPAKNPKAREQNRRVEFVITWLEGQPETLPAKAPETIPQADRPILPQPGEEPRPVPKADCPPLPPPETVPQSKLSK